MSKKVVVRVVLARVVAKNVVVVLSIMAVVVVRIVLLNVVAKNADVVVSIMDVVAVVTVVSSKVVV